MYTTTVKLTSNREKLSTHLKYRSLLADELIGQFCSRKTFSPKKVIPSTKRKPTDVGRGRIILPGNNSRLKRWVITCPLLENIIAVGIEIIKKMSKDQKSTAMNVRLLFA